MPTLQHHIQDGFRLSPKIFGSAGAHSAPQLPTPAETPAPAAEMPKAKSTPTGKKASPKGAAFAGRADQTELRVPAAATRGIPTSQPRRRRDPRYYPCAAKRRPLEFFAQVAEAVVRLRL